MAGLPAARRFDDGPSERLSSLGDEAPRSHGSRWPPAFEAITDTGQAAIAGALLPLLAPDAVLCTDGHVTYERIAKDGKIPHFAVSGARRSKRAHHINTVNALIGRFRAFMQPSVVGPRRA